jgi:predicted RNA-binding Zn ribbon-like protein
MMGGEGMSDYATAPHATAPGELAQVHAFLNTTFAEGSRERFDTPERLHDWLAKRSLIEPTTSVSLDDFQTVLALRDALRVLIAGGIAPEQRDALNRMAARAPLLLNFGAEGSPFLMPGAEGVPGAIARILAAIVAAEREGNWSRLKQCRNRECQRVFYDTSKNHSAVWCSSQRCGNRMAARAYRARAAGAPDGS